MFTTSQDVLYITVSACTAVFTLFLVWIMYYAVQITRQSNEMITDFREKIEDLDATVQVIKEKVTTSVDSLSSVSQQISTILEIVRSFTSLKSKRRNNKN